MTSIATTTGMPTDQSPGFIGLLARRDRAAMVAVAVLCIAFLAVFFRWFSRQFGPNGFSIGFPEDWAHSYFVPLISGYYIWRHRERLLEAPSETFWPGLVLVAGGIVAYAYFVIGYPNHMFQGASMLLVIAGLVILLAGPRVFGLLVFPIGYLALGVTISERVMNAITFRLKLLASVGSHHFLEVIGVQNDLAGNQLTIYSSSGVAHPMNVADACSGMRMVIAFIALAAAVAFLSCRLWWQRIALLMLAIPVALLMNVIRVTILAVLTLYDPELAVGEAHTFIGTLLLIPAFVIFMVCVWALNQMVTDEPPRRMKAGGA